MRSCGPDFRALSLRGETTLEQRFLELWGRRPNATAVWHLLKSAYAESHRRFHTLQHIDECLQVVEQYASIVGWDSVPRELELALWFHDVIYKPGAKDNERRSAELFRALAKEGELDDQVIEGAVSLIQETKDHEARGALPSGIMCDSDLWILGSSPERYGEYAQQIRLEFSEYSALKYRLGRRRFLKRVLRRKFVYTNPLFEEAFGAQARENMESELNVLKTEASSEPEVTRKDLPGLSDYYIISTTTPGTGSDVDDAFFLAAHREARALARSRYGDPDCYSLVYNGARVRRRNWPHFHVLLASTRRQKRLGLLLLWFKRPLGVLAAARRRLAGGTGRGIVEALVLSEPPSRC